MDISQRAKVSIKIYLLSFVGISFAIPSHSKTRLSNLIIVCINGSLKCKPASTIGPPIGFPNSVLTACSFSKTIKNEFRINTINITNNMLK